MNEITVGMTPSEAIAELRGIAVCFGIRGIHSGKVSQSLKYRCNEFLLKNGVPFRQWCRWPRFRTQPGSVGGMAIPVHLLVIHDVIDDEAHVLCAEIAHWLTLVNWRELSSSDEIFGFGGYTPDQAEADFKKASERIATLCDDLEKLPNNSEYRPYDGTGAHRSKGV